MDASFVASASSRTLFLVVKEFCVDSGLGIHNKMDWEQSTIVNLIGSDEIHVSKWFTYGLLKFLDDKDESHKTISNYTSQTNDDENQRCIENMSEIEDTDACQDSEDVNTPQPSRCTKEILSPSTTREVFKLPPKRPVKSTNVIAKWSTNEALLMHLRVGFMKCLLVRPHSAAFCLAVPLPLVCTQLEMVRTHDYLSFPHARYRPVD
uniref:Uncharacterized protein n=1 Tax=Timema bartmani TaxID=61472 RepID=A0A7R9F0Q0_9NEOP|nr:unnamed protein product [Timema bartmani]